MQIRWGALLLLMSLSAAADDVADKLREKLAPIIKSEIAITAIKPSPVPNIYMVQVGAEVLYATADGRYVFKGDLLDLVELNNLSQIERKHMRSQLLAEIPPVDYIEFVPAKKSAASIIYVFTDVDCSYCRHFHKDVPKLNDAGVAVRYLAFPRSGMLSDSARVMQQVWCAEDRSAALTAVKTDAFFPGSRECDDPVAKHYMLGQSLGVRGTPAIFLENGKLLPGYMPPAALLNFIAESKQTDS